MAICDDEFELHNRGDVVVDAHNHGVGAVCVFGVVAKICLALFEAHTVFSCVLHDIFTNGCRDSRDEERKTTDAVLRDVEHIALWHAVDEIGFNQFRKILFAFHIGEPSVVRRAYVEKRCLGERNGHFVKHEKNNKFLHLAIKRSIDE